MGTLGSYTLQDALNRALPVFKRMLFGDRLDTLMKAVAAHNTQIDALMALTTAGGITTGSGTIAVGGSVTNGDYITSITVTNALVPSLVSGTSVGPIAIVTADTTTTVATKIAAALNANTVLAALGYIATSSTTTVTLTTIGLAGASTTWSTALSSGATITLTPTNASGGAGAIVGRNATAYPLPTLASIP
jgi:hypothetical protein